VEDASDFHSRHVLTPRVFDALRRSVAQTAQSPGRAVEAIEADKDHVHLLFAFQPDLALSTIVQRIKGASSRSSDNRDSLMSSKSCGGNTCGNPPVASSPA